MSTVRLEYSHGGAVADVVLAAPASRNALSRALLDDLAAALDTVHLAIEARAVRALVLRHEPPVFCAGLDLRERSGIAGDSIGGGSGHALAHVIGRLMTLPAPTIAAVKGPVRAGGIGLMAACDMPVVQRDVDFSFTEVRIGVAPAIISVPVLARCGWSSLAAPFLTGEVFGAPEALRIGLVTHVADDAEGVARIVDSLCEGVMAGAPGAVAAATRLLRPAGSDPSAAMEALARMAELSDELFATDEAAEGIAAFFEKRLPGWRAPR
ncbi:MAG: hypothetical protein RJB61_2234 [Actinomycetota bacterium]